MRRLAQFLCLILLCLPVAVRAQDANSTPEPTLEATSDVPPIPVVLPTEEAPTEPVTTGDILPAAALIDEGGYDIVNILLIGATTNSFSGNPGLTDSLLIISINRSTETVSVVSLPRDLWVYAPGFGMVKINQTYFFAEVKEEGTGADLLKETVLYNLGLQIDFYAKVNFDTFGELINSVGGIEVSVDCSIQDWVLKADATDRNDPDSWEMYTLPVGQHTLRGDLALWYVRSRRTSSDIDRGRRQQDVLRALYRKIRANGLLENFPALWQQITQMVETDITLPDALNLLPVAVNTETADVQYYTMRLNEEIINGISDDEGRFILEIQPDALHRLMQQVVLPPTTSQTQQVLPTVAVINASGVRGLERVAADRLELEGFRTVIVEEQTERRAMNMVIDYTGLDKSNPVDRIVETLSVQDSDLVVEPDPSRDYDYRVYVGREYPRFACTRPVQAPRPVDQ